MDKHLVRRGINHTERDALDDTGNCVNDPPATLLELKPSLAEMKVNIKPPQEREAQ